MKLLTVLIFQVCFVIAGLVQNNLTYYQYITQAQLAFSQEEYKSASDYYAKAFQDKRPYNYDLHLAMQIELDYAGGREKIIKQYMQFYGGKGTDISGEEYVKNMSRAYPKFGTLPYVDELMEMYNNIEPINQEAYKHVQAFEKILNEDQAIRDSVRQVLGYGVDIYASRMSGSIRQVDELNMEKLLVLLQDKTLNEYDCNACFNSLETVVSHATGNGNTDWIEPLQTIQLEGRMDDRRFVRIIDGAHNATDPMVSKKLKELGFYYGSFNGIRLYNVMLFTTYSPKEKRAIENNRKKIGFVSLSDEIAIKTWQFQHNDQVRFYPFISFIYSDGTEDEATVTRLLQEQETMVQQAIEEQQKRGKAELIIVRK